MAEEPSREVMSDEALPAWLDQEAYPFPHRWLSLPAGRVHMADTGTGGTPVLFVHGTPTWSFEWRHLIAALSPSRRVIAPDHLGFGLSERPERFRYRPEDHAAVLAALVEELALPQFDLVVHDFGGPIGLPLALADPRRVRRLVVLNSWMWSFDDDAEMQKRARMVEGGFGRFMYRVFNASLKLIMPSAYGDRKKLTKAIHAQYLAPFAHAPDRVQVLWPLAHALLGSAAHYRGLWEQRARLADVPVTVIWGMKDTAFRPHQLDRWRAAVPHARVVELPDAGHWPHEEDPATVERIVREALDP